MVKVGICLDLHCRLINPRSRKDDYFNACIKKLEFMLKNCDILLSAGDFFDKSRTEDVVKNRVLSLLSRYETKIYVVPGNHDIENDEPGTLGKTSLGNLAYHKAVTILTPDRIWDIAGLRIGVLPYHIKDAKSIAFSEHTDLILGHHFYNWSQDLTQSIEPEDVEKYNTDYLFLGHDHEPHKIETVGKTKIYRMGSVMRDRLQAYSQTHVPKFVIFNKKEPIEVVLPHEPYEKVFRFEEKKYFKKCTKLMSDIKGFLDGINIKSENQRTIGSILKEELNAPEEVQEYLHLIYRLHHLEF